MRIRIHKSRSVTSSFVVGILIVGGVSVAAPNIFDAFNNNSIEQAEGKLPGQDGSPGNSQNKDNGKSCDARNKIINDNTKGNGAVSDCPDDDTPPNVCDNGASNYPTCTFPPDVCENGAGNYPTCTFPPGVCENGANNFPTCKFPPGGGGPERERVSGVNPTASPLPAAKIIVAKMTKMSTTYNRTRQGISYTVEPNDASCKVTYNGKSAMPTNAGTYDVVINCKDGKVTGGTTGTFVIEKAQPQLTWSDPNSMKTTDALTGKELKAKSDVTGTYSYSPAAGTKMPAGMHNLKVKFTPRDEANYMSASTSVKVMVVKDVNTFKPIKVPFTMSSFGLTAASRPMVSEIFLNNDVTAVTVYGYVQPSNNKAADMKLSLQRAQTVAKQLKSISPGLKITIKAMGASINSACKAELNKCVIVK